MMRALKQGSQAFWTGGIIMLTALSLSACVSRGYYVDRDTPEVAKSEFSVPAKPQPAYLVYEFQTRGVRNPGATTYTTPKVRERVKASGLFSEILDQPEQGVAMLNITLNNVPVTENPMAKGFISGLTLGSVGALVTDSYVCVARYSAPGTREPVIVTGNHALHSVIGSTDQPPNGTQMASLDEAVQTMIRQIVDNTLKRLSEQAEFSAQPQ